MKSLSFFFSLLFILLTMTSKLFSQNVIVTYSESFDNFANPERGIPLRVDPPWPDLQWLNKDLGIATPAQNRFLTWEEVPWSFCETDESKYTYNNWTEALDLDELKQQRAQGITLVMVRYHLADFRRRKLTPAFLARMEADFNTAREAGVKLVPRFAYNYPKGGPDTSVEWVLVHLEQLQPLLQEHYSIIAFSELGFVGCWGEGHSTANELMSANLGYRRINSATKAIIDKFFEVLPQQRMIAVRYPEYKFQYFNGLQENAIQENKPIAPVTIQEAYNGSIRSRWGQHDDCWACGEWNAGTYLNPYTRAQASAKAVTDFLKADNEFTVQGGEIGAGCCDLPDDPVDEDNDGWSSDYDACERIIPMFKKARVSTTNILDDLPRVERWKNEGCFDEIQRSMGYRFVLREAIVPSQVKTENLLTIGLKISNVGWARPYNPRAAEVVLRNKVNGQIYSLPINAPQDERLWLPGPDQTKDLSVNVSLPKILAAGQYEVLLNLPDPHPSLRDDPHYSIRLANEDIWEASTGYNKLNVTITVDSNPVSPSGTGLSYVLYNNKTLSNSPISTGTDATVNFDWQYGGKASGQPTDNFSVRWTGQVMPQYSETYTFYTQADDGTRLWVNGELLIDDWTNHAVREKQGKISLQAGKQYDIKLEYFENGGAAVCKLFWSSAGQSKQVVPKANLYAANWDDAPATATYTIRAKGVAGTEEMALLIDGNPVKSWTVSTVMTDYTYTGEETGPVRVAITNDEGKDHDLKVDKLSVDETVYQAEDQLVNTGVWQGQCGGTKSEWLHCSGYIQFDLKNSTARQTHQHSKQPVSQASSQVLIYPNPSQDGSFTVRGVSQGSQVKMYDLQGRNVAIVTQTVGEQQLQVQPKHKPTTGLYIIQIHQPDHQRWQQKVSIK